MCIRDRETDSKLPEIWSPVVEIRISVERHQACVELFDDVVEIDLSSLLVIAWAPAASEIGLSILAENLELTHADRFRKQIAAKHISALTVGIRGVISAKSV